MKEEHNINLIQGGLWNQASAIAKQPEISNAINNIDAVVMDNTNTRDGFVYSNKNLNNINRILSNKLVISLGKKSNFMQLVKMLEGRKGVVQVTNEHFKTQLKQQHFEKIKPPMDIVIHEVPMLSCGKQF